MALERLFGRVTPPRVAFFVWTTVLRKILTMDNLRKNIIVTE
jgi:hypothetical protein